MLTLTLDFVKESFRKTINPKKANNPKGTFIKKIKQQFEGDYKIEFNLAPPLISKKDPITGQLKKRTFGPWMMNAFRLLAKLKVLRGTAFDIFGKTEENMMENISMIKNTDMVYLNGVMEKNMKKEN